MVQETTSDALTTVIKRMDVLIHCILPINLCRAQAYDVVHNRPLSGVAKRLQDEEPAAIKVYYLAHSLNVCLQNTAKKC